LEGIRIQYSRLATEKVVLPDPFGPAMMRSCELGSAMRGIIP
jgi:hypothetical protein